MIRKVADFSDRMMRSATDELHPVAAADHRRRPPSLNLPPPERAGGRDQ